LASVPVDVVVNDYISDIKHKIVCNQYDAEHQIDQKLLVESAETTKDILHANEVLKNKLKDLHYIKRRDRSLVRWCLIFISPMITVLAVAAMCSMYFIPTLENNKYVIRTNSIDCQQSNACSILVSDITYGDESCEMVLGTCQKFDEECFGSVKKGFRRDFPCKNNSYNFILVIFACVSGGCAFITSLIASTHLCIIRRSDAEYYKYKT
jgi:hypothetical protein